MKRSIGGILALALAAWPAGAQSAATAAQPKRSPDTVIVTTLPLRHLKSAEAVQLLSPYATSAGGGVYSVPNARAVTIREMPITIVRMQKVLAEYDRAPEAVSFTFQLIAADNSGNRAPEVASLDSLLRGVLKFTGYRLLTTAVTNASENSTMAQQMSVCARPCEMAGMPADAYTLIVNVVDVRTDGSDASVRVNVDLRKRNYITNPADGTRTPMGEETVLSTGVSVPFGHTVVLGTATTDGGSKALILTVKPQLPQAKGRSPE